MWKKVLFVVLLILGVAGFCAIPYFVGVKETFATIGSVGWPCIATYVLLASFTMVIPAIGWWILMRSEGIPATPWQAIKANIMGMPLNFFTPSAYLGAEPLKIIYLSKVTGVQKRRVLATVVAAKVQEVASLIFLMVVSAAFFAWRGGLHNKRDETLILIGTGLLAVLFGGLMLAYFKGAQPSVKAINLLAKLGVAKRRLARLRTKAKDMERIIHAIFVHRWKTFILAQAVTSLSALSIFIRLPFFFLFIPRVTMVSLEDTAMVYVIVNFINTITFVPGAFGLLEGGVVGYFKLRYLGTPLAESFVNNVTAFGIVNRIADFFYILMGAWMIAHYGMTGTARGVARGTEKIEERDLLEAAEAEERGGTVTRPPGPLQP